MRLKYLIILFLTIINSSVYLQIYVAPDGSDSNPGTIELPLESIQQAQTLVSAGETVFIRGSAYLIRPDQISHVEHNN